MFKVYGYAVNGGDGSTGIAWYLDSDLDEDRFQDYDFETYCDGDGCGPKIALTFDTEEDAVKAGLPHGIEYFNYNEE